jgi:hypothetical protein
LVCNPETVKQGLNGMGINSFQAVLTFCFVPLCLCAFVPICPCMNEILDRPPLQDAGDDEA